MTAFNPHPLANPLNQHRFEKQHSFAISTPADPRELTVPEAKPYDPDAYHKLTVPNSDIPCFDGPVPASGFLGDSSLFKLADGSVIDIKAKKIVYDPNKKWKAQGYWNDPSCTMPAKHEAEWGANETIESMLNRIGNADGTYNDPNLSPESIAYWKRANEESNRLEQNLTDEQKQLLADLNDGKIFPLSKLVDEQ